MSERKNLLELNEDIAREHLRKLAEMICEMKNVYYDNAKNCCEKSEECKPYDVTSFETIAIEELVEKII